MRGTSQGKVLARDPGQADPNRSRVREILTSFRERAGISGACEATHGDDGVWGELRCQESISGESSAEESSNEFDIFIQR